MARNMFEERTPETIIIFGSLLYLCLYIFHRSFDVFNLIILFYSLIYVSHVSDVFKFGFCAHPLCIWIIIVLFMWVMLYSLFHFIIDVSITIEIGLFVYMFILQRLLKTIYL